MLKDFNKIDGLKVLANEPLKQHSYLKVGGTALAVIIPQTKNSLLEALKVCNSKNLPTVVIGHGSNILFPDELFEKIVIKINSDLKCLNSISVEDHFSKKIISIGAGVSKSELVKYAIDNSFKNFAFLTGIPGTIGGGIKMNAGISNQSFENILRSFTTITINGEEKTYRNEKALFEYRKLNIEEGEIILSAKLYAKPGILEEIKKEVERINKIRKTNHPLNYPNCGSVFKNPPHAPAGLLIEKNNLKGYTIGGAQISKLHANFIVNLGDATSKDIRDLIAHIKEVIKKNENIDLKEEVIVLD